MYGINFHSIVLINSLIIIILIRDQMTNPPNITYTIVLSLTSAGNNDKYPSFWPEIICRKNVRIDNRDHSNIYS